MKTLCSFQQFKEHADIFCCQTSFDWGRPNGSLIYAVGGMQYNINNINALYLMSTSITNITVSYSFLPFHVQDFFKEINRPYIHPYFNFSSFKKELRNCTLKGRLHKMNNQKYSCSAKRIQTNKPVWTLTKVWFTQLD